MNLRRCGLEIIQKKLYRWHRSFKRFKGNVTASVYSDIDAIRRRFASLKPERDVISLMTHEQYCYPDYFNYIPNHLDRIEEACRQAAEYGCKSAWFAEGIWGNTSWGK